MSEYLLYNGAFQKNSTPLITADNRGLRFGDGLFETLKYADGKIHLADWHFDRLFKGLQLMAFEWPAWFTAAYINGKITELCKKNQHAVARVRITMFRGNGGLYDPENHFPNYIIQSWALPEPGFRLNENGLVIGMYTAASKSMDAFSNIKSNNFLPYTMAALHAKKNQWNDALVLNIGGRICDATIANVFIVKDAIVSTPPLPEGCIEGVMRRFLLEQLPLNKISVQENGISVDDVLNADEVFLTNAIKGIRWVGRCGESSYNNHLSQIIFSKLLKK